MEKKYFSADVGKIVLTTGGDVVGVVKSAAMATGYKRQVGAFCFDEESGAEFAFGNESVFCVGEDAIILKERPIPLDGCLPSPVGRSVFSLCGKSLGTVTDLALQNAKVVGLVTSAGEYAAEKVVAIGQSVLIDLAPTRTKLPTPRRKKTAPEKEAAAETNTRCGEQLLLGRKVKRDVYNQKGQRIAAEGDVITRELLQEVKKYGKVYELTVGSLSNLF